MTRNDAEIFALGALEWVAEAELLDAFMGATGAERDQIAGAAEDPAFLGAVLDFVMMDDAWVRGACEAQGARYESVQRARMALPGGEQTHWT